MIKTYPLLYHPKAEKSLKKIHPNDQDKILNKLYLLQKDPFSQKLNIRKLANTEKSYRIRAGNLRAIYEFDTKNRKIYVWEIGYRGNIY